MSNLVVDHISEQRGTDSLWVIKFSGLKHCNYLLFKTLRGQKSRSVVRSCTFIYYSIRNCTLTISKDNLLLSSFCFLICWIANLIYTVKDYSSQKKFWNYTWDGTFTFDTRNRILKEKIVKPWFIMSLFQELKWSANQGA